MSQEVGLNLPLAPVVDGKGDCVKADGPVSQEEATEVDPLYLVEHCIETGDLPDVVADDVEETPGNVRLTELPVVLTDPRAVELQSKILKQSRHFVLIPP